MMIIVAAFCKSKFFKWNSFLNNAETHFFQVYVEFYTIFTAVLNYLRVVQSKTGLVKFPSL